MSNPPASTPESPLPDRVTLEAQLAAALDAGRAAGADAIAAGIQVSRGQAVQVRRGALEQAQFHADRGLSVTAYRGQRCASATTTDLSEEGIRVAAQRAADLARHTGEDPWSGLPDPAHLATRFPALDLYHPWGLAVADAVDLALECEAAAMGADPRVEHCDAVSVDTGEAVSAYANSHGFFGCRQSSQHGLGCAVIARADGRMQRDHWSTAARAAADLESPQAVGRRAGERAAARLGAATPATVRAPVLFPPELARSLFGHFVAGVSGGALYRDASFLKGRIGARLFGAPLGLVQRPHLPRAMASAAFDAEGVACAERALVADGVLQGYVLDSYAARRLAMQTTGNAGGVFNLCVEGGGGDLAGMMRQMGRGFLLTELMGQGVSLITGDYSRGAAGFWVEDGQIAYPVENVTIASNLAELYAGMVGLGDDADVRGAIRAPSVLIESMMIAGQ